MFDNEIFVFISSQLKMEKVIMFWKKKEQKKPQGQLGYGTN